MKSASTAGAVKQAERGGDRETSRRQAETSGMDLEEPINSGEAGLARFR